MHRLLLATLLFSTGLAARAQAPEATLDWGGKLWLQGDSTLAAGNGPLARANAVHPGIASQGRDSATLAAELRAAAQGWNALVTLQQQALHNQPARSTSWVNELAYTGTAGDWQLSAGKKIVSWDVGYSFRPNDLVQQEVRRTLVSSSATGRPLLQAEHFASDSAWALVAVNPGDSPDARAADEPALAARYYRHQGAADWYGFGRSGQRTGASLGAALAWVASDALELHASVRALERADTLAFAAAPGALATQTPWRNGSVGDAAQALLGAQWTSAQQLSVLLEAWWDGTALSPAQWDSWRQRNQGLERLAAQGAPLAAVAGNLVWQADAFAASSSLQRSNLFLRLAWDHEGWQPALELLHHPADGGHMLTASLRYQGDRVRLQGGLRSAGGPEGAVLAQLPYRQQAYLQSSWAF